MPFFFIIALLAAPPASAPASAPTSAPVCPSTSTTELDGVRIVIAAPRCQFTLAEVAAGIQVPYAVEVQKKYSRVTLRTVDAGGCRNPGASGLIVGERVEGGDEHYCICDVGLCPRGDRQGEVAPGRYPEVFEWDGRNWDGPSDTGNEKGPPFPPGTYTLQLQAAGEYGGRSFAIRATLPITITP